MTQPTHAPNNGQSTYQIADLTIATRPAGGGLEITWNTDSPAAYPMLRGYRKTGSLAGIEQEQFLIINTNQPSGSQIDRIERGRNYFYLFRLHDMPRSNLFEINEDTMESAARDLDNYAEKRRAIRRGSPPPSNSQSLVPSSPNTPSSDGSAIEKLLVGLYTSWAVNNRERDDLPLAAKIVNGIISAEDVEKIKQGAPHPSCISFSASLSFRHDQHSKTKTQIDAIIADEKMKQNAIKKLEDEHNQEILRVMNDRSLSSSQRAEKVQYMQDRFEDMIDKIMNI